MEYGTHSTGTTLIDMQRALPLLIVCCLLGLMGRAEALVIEGYYQGKDLYVKNPLGPKGVGFCVYEVQVNGEITSDEIHSSAFIIDLHHLGLSVGSPMVVQIMYHEDCRPNVLNSEVVLPASTFDVLDIQLDEDGTLVWKTKNEMGELPYVIQQFKWNKWVDLGEVPGTGRMEENTYQFKMEPHSGRNTVRVYQRTNKNKKRYSEEVSMFSARPSVDMVEDRVKDELELSSETHFEIFDEYGRLVKRGYDSTLDVSELEKGVHYINFDKIFGASFVKH